MTAGRSGAPPPAPEPLPVAVPDSHAHLDIAGGDPAVAIAAAAAVGVDRLVQIGVDVQSSRWSVELAAAKPAILATVALHPNEAPRLGRDLDRALRQIEELAGHPRVRGIGETGMDAFRTAASGRAAQEYSFRAHIDIAKRYGKALVIHDRDAHDAILSILDSQGAPDSVVLHCFSGDAAFAAECVRRGYVLSFAGTVTFANAPAIREAAAVTPLSQLLVETDAPFLTPVPYRGRPNGSYLIPLTVRAVTQIKQMDLAEVCAGVSATAERVFGTW
jgi:TatD DNase family protein